MRQSVQDNSNQKLVIGRFLQKDFEVSLSSKTYLLSVWKEHFPVFWKVLNDEVKTILWESEIKC